jgi:hypothetical protein
MFSIQARSRFLDLSKSFKALYVIAAGIFISIFSYIVYQNIIVTVTLAACTIASYILVSQPPTTMTIKIDEEGVNIDQEIISWENLVAWAMVDLGDDLEFIIATNNPIKDYYFFYINENLPEVRQLLQILTQYLAYDTEIISKNKTHNIMRTLGLK